jgi:hypothetical protein
MEILYTLLFNETIIFPKRQELDIYGLLHEIPFREM